MPSKQQELIDDLMHHWWHHWMQANKVGDKEDAKVAALAHGMCLAALTGKFLILDL